MPKPRTLKVYPNPFAHIDHEGRPSCVVALEPIGDGITVFDDRRFVGATLKATITKKVPRGSAQQNEQDTWFEYGDESSTVPLTPYYVRAVRDGSLLAADEDSAKKAGVKFQDPGKVLTAARDNAVKHLKDVLAHEAHDSDFADALKKFAFGPMPDAKKPESDKPEEGKPNPEGDRPTLPQVDKKTAPKGGA